MAKTTKTAAFVLAVALLAPGGDLAAKTDLTVTSTVPGVTIPDIPGLTDEVQAISDLNGPYIANSVALANILGYPVGKAHIEGFQLGVAMGAGMTNMAYFDKNDPAHENGSIPGIIPSPVLHFGMGLTDRIDVLGKYFSLSSAAVDPHLESELATLTDYKLLSIGGKLRYNVVKPAILIPFIFNFGGVTVSLGADFMYGDVSVKGSYDAKYNGVEVDYGTGPTPVPLDFSGDYEASALYSIFSINAQALVYFDIIYLFSVYTGFGLSGNLGYTKIRADAEGDLSTDDPAYNLTTGDDQVGTIVFTSENRYTPYYGIPAYIFGLEINLYVLKLTAETMVNLYNLSDVTAQTGVRIQI